MLEMVATEPATASAERDEFVRTFRHMLVARLLDDRFASLYRAGKIHGGVFLGRGQEAVSAALGVQLRRGDVYAPLIRDAAGRLAFGEPIIDAVRTYLGSPLGPMRGRDGNVHRGRPKEGLVPMVSHLGATISVVTGALMAKRFQGEKDVVGAACAGDGATSTGSFHEAMNQAAVEKVPLVMVVTDNHYAYSTPTSRQFACNSLLDRAVGYGIEGHAVDGTDIVDCLRVMKRAVSDARRGGGPQLIIAKLLRLCGHGEHDDASYIDPKLKQSPCGRDCLKVAEESGARQSWLDHAVVDSWRAEATREIEETVAKVQREGAPDAYTEEWSAISTEHLREWHDEAAR
ncbi:MAG TPA: thiamine pyrophosphate-dependent dehydrogenase E1 component subunit alpha [Candidatus Acidoferrum sp.]|nr:thiamine pyrophosphate-dependent dehydrogenase E1 component subunit alpha [Candidatus Acidoferrum sp.]